MADDGSPPPRRSREEKRRAGSKRKATRRSFGVGMIKKARATAEGDNDGTSAAAATTSTTTTTTAAALMAGAEGVQHTGQRLPAALALDRQHDETLTEGRSHASPGGGESKRERRDVRQRHRQVSRRSFGVGTLKRQQEAAAAAAAAAAADGGGGGATVAMPAATATAASDDDNGSSSGYDDVSDDGGGGGGVDDERAISVEAPDAGQYMSPEKATVATAVAEDDTMPPPVPVRMSAPTATATSTVAAAPQRKKRKRGRPRKDERDVADEDGTKLTAEERKQKRLAKADARKSEINLVLHAFLAIIAEYNDELLADDIAVPELTHLRSELELNLNEYREIVEEHRVLNDAYKRVQKQTKSLRKELLLLQKGRDKVHRQTAAIRAQFSEQEKERRMVESAHRFLRDLQTLERLADDNDNGDDGQGGGGGGDYSAAGNLPSLIASVATGSGNHAHVLRFNEFLRSLSHQLDSIPEDAT